MATPPTPMIAVRISVIVSILERDDNAHETWEYVVYHVKNGNWETVSFFLQRESYERVDAQRPIGAQCLTETKQDSVVLPHDSINPDVSRAPISIQYADARNVKISGDAVFLSEGSQFRL